MTVDATTSAVDTAVAFVTAVQDQDMAREEWISTLATLVDTDLLATVDTSGAVAADYSYGLPVGTPTSQSFNTGRLLSVIVTTDSGARVKVMLSRLQQEDPWRVAWWEEA